MPGCVWAGNLPAIPCHRGTSCRWFSQFPLTPSQLVFGLPAFRSKEMSLGLSEVLAMQDRANDTTGCRTMQTMLLLCCWRLACCVHPPAKISLTCYPCIWCSHELPCKLAWQGGPAGGRDKPARRRSAKRCCWGALKCDVGDPAVRGRLGNKSY